MSSDRRAYHFGRDLLHRLQVVCGAAGLTLLFFLVLPLMQAIAGAPATDRIVRAAETGKIPPPDEVVEEEPEEPEEEEPEPPELSEEVQPLDLSQLEMALTPGFSEGWMGGADFSFRIDQMVGGGQEDTLFAAGELDQRPRPIHQSMPALTPEIRRAGGGTVYVIFMVNVEGRVENAKIQSSPNPIFNQAALEAVKKWKYEPGRRNGRPAPFPVRQPITFPSG